VDADAAVAANNLAWILADTHGDFERALPLATRAASLLPDRGDVLHTLGWIQHRRGDHASAVATFKNSLERDPGNPQFLYHLALASVATGDRSTARTALTKALEGRRTFEGSDAAARLLAALPE
jgi:Flp pilus assembly protein TadD